MIFASVGSVVMLVIGPAMFAVLVAASRLTAALVTGEGPEENHWVGVAFVVPPVVTAAANAAVGVPLTTAATALATDAPAVLAVTFKIGTLVLALAVLLVKLMTKLPLASLDTTPVSPPLALS